MTKADVLTMIEAAQLLRYNVPDDASSRHPQLQAFRSFVRRHHVPTLHRGSRLLFDRLVIEQLLKTKSTDASRLETDIEAGRRLAKVSAAGVRSRLLRMTS